MKMILLSIICALLPMSINAEIITPVKAVVNWSDNAITKDLPVISDSLGFQGQSTARQISIFGSSATPPDVGGALGTNHFVQTANGCIFIFDREGKFLSGKSINNLFPAVNGTFDPHVIYDTYRSRYIIVCLDRGNPRLSNNSLWIATSMTNDPTGAWEITSIKLASTTQMADYPTIAIDKNGIYLGINILNAQMTSNTILYTRYIVINTSLDKVWLFDDKTYVISGPIPACATDNSTTMWWGISNAGRTNISLRPLTWVNNEPTLGTYTSIPTPETYYPVAGTAKGSMPIDITDHKLISGIMRNNKLYFCRHIGVNNQGMAANADRTAVEWFQFDISSMAPALLQSGRIYDTSTTSPMSYYYPSIAVAYDEFLAMGFSGSNANTYVGVYMSYRYPLDSNGYTSPPSLIQEGVNGYIVLDSKNRNRWGDFTSTIVDPINDNSIWTLQQYASNKNEWGTWMARTRKPSPMILNNNIALNSNTTSIVNIVASDFANPSVINPDGIVSSIESYDNRNIKLKVTTTVPGAYTIYIVSGRTKSQLYLEVTQTTGTNITQLSPLPRSGAIGEKVTLASYLLSNKQYLSNKKIIFKVIDTEYIAFTDTKGIARATIVIPSTNGTTVPCSAIFNGDSIYSPTQTIIALSVNVNRSTTFLAYPPLSAKANTYIKIPTFLYHIMPSGDMIPMANMNLSVSINETPTTNLITDKYGKIIPEYLIPNTQYISIKVRFNGITGYSPSEYNKNITVVQ